MQQFAQPVPARQLTPLATCSLSSDSGEGRQAGRRAGGRAAGGAVSDLNHHGCRNDYSAGWHVRPCAYLIICPDQRPAAGRPALARVGTFSTQFRFKI